VPSRWALLVGDASGNGSPVDGATTALAASLATQLTEQKDLARPLSLEQFLDDAAYAAEQAGAEPVLEGRFDRNLPMRQYR
jgi:hypothetical protein